MSTLAPPSRPKSSTLRPLDLDSHIRVPQQYAKTRILYEGLLEESSYLLAEWLATEAVHGSVAFPEIVVPILVQLRKSLKDAKSVQGSGKNQGVVKILLERIEESARWVEGRRNNVTFAPGNTENVDEWERDLKTRVTDSPLSKFVRIQKKARENRQKLVEKVFISRCRFSQSRLLFFFFIRRLGKEKVLLLKPIRNNVKAGYCDPKNSPCRTVRRV